MFDCLMPVTFSLSAFSPSVDFFFRRHPKLFLFEILLNVAFLIVSLLNVPFSFCCALYIVSAPLSYLPLYRFIDTSHVSAGALLKYFGVAKLSCAPPSR